MIISLKDWQRYTKKLSSLSEKAVDEFRKWINENGGYANMDRDTIIEYAYALARKYGEGSATLSAAMYDAVAILQNASVPSAIPAETATYQQVAKKVNGIIKNTASDEILAQSVGLLVKNAGEKTIIENAQRDRAEIAFIPHGATCAYCITLGSKGWKDAYDEELEKDGEPVHLHANCDCTYGVRFNDKLKYKGYNEKKYQKMYYNAPLRDGEKNTAENRMKALRRKLEGRE